MLFIYSQVSEQLSCTWVKFSSFSAKLWGYKFTFLERGRREGRDCVCLFYVLTEAEIGIRSLTLEVSTL